MSNAKTVRNLLRNELMNEITTEKALTITQQVYYMVFLDGYEIGYGWTERTAIEYAERYMKMMTEGFI